MQPTRNTSRRRRQGSSLGSWDNRRTIDYTRFYIFLSVIVVLIAAISIYVFMNELDGDDDDDEGTDDVDTVTLNCYNPSHRITPNGTAEFVLLVENSATSKTHNIITLEVTSKPDNWTAKISEPIIRLAKESRGIRFLKIEGLSGVEDGNFEFEVTARSINYDGMDTTKVEVEPKEWESNKTVESGDSLTTNYVGYLEDGRIFDTSVELVAKSDVPKTDDFQVRGSYSEFTFTADDGQVIPGFDAGVMDMSIDQTKIIVVPPSQGYTQEGHALYGKTLYFELTMEDIN